MAPCLCVGGGERLLLAWYKYYSLGGRASFIWERKYVRWVAGLGAAGGQRGSVLVADETAGP